MGEPVDLELGPDDLRRRLDPSTLAFYTTAAVEPLEGTIGQPRALDAIQFGLEVDADGYNLFVSGTPGSGRTGTILDHLERVARDRPPPADWVYVYDFAQPDRPNAIRLPSGRGVELARDMDEFLRGARREIPRAFESEDYDRRRREVLGEVARRRDEVTESLEAFARERGFAVEMTPAGIVTLPLVEGRPISAEDFSHLSEAEQEDVERRGQEVQQRIPATLRQLRQLEQEATQRVRALERDVAQYAVGPLFHELRERYSDVEEVVEYLGQVEEDLPEHLTAFRPSEPELPSLLAALQTPDREDGTARYRVNVLIGDHGDGGAPVVFERNPTYYNLVGRIDYRGTFGAMVTDFHQVKAGALHRANGGFLVLHALDVLRNPFAWDALKRTLMTGRAQIENLGEQYAALPTATLRPEPVELDLKVVLIGSTYLYRLLYALDEDFRELFKVRVDFAPEMAWTDEHVQNYARFVSRRVTEAGLRHFDRSGVARVVEHGARLRDHQRKLSTRLLEVADIVTEASFVAGRAGHELVTAEDVQRAIDQREYRSNLLEERVLELIEEGTITIDTDGERVGQVNGLAVLDVGDHVFGKPSRVTARVSLGRGAVQSIEREIDLSGPIHSKGFLILSGYLAATYAQDWPLALAGTITFEQAYEGVDGDSASSTELYALLSALSGVPLRQALAVTGSVDQNGIVQAVGGVTAKIEGFFRVCEARGLTGAQGVLVPRANVSHLMLSDAVVEAVRAGSFHVYAVGTIDEGLELLTGRPAGERLPDGTFPEDTVHRLVQDRLRAYAERARELGLQREDAAEED